MHDKFKSEGCPNDELFCKFIKNNNFIRKLSEELCFENCPTIHVGGAHELFRRVTQQIHIGGLSNVFISEGCPQLKQIFLLNTIFTHGISMCEGVGRDSRHGIGHVDIQVGSCVRLNVFSGHYMCT